MCQSGKRRMQRRKRHQAPSPLILRCLIPERTIIALPGPAAHCHHSTKGTDAMPIVENCQRYAVEKQRHHCSNKKTQGKKSGRSH